MNVKPQKMPHWGRKHSPDIVSSSGRRTCFLGRADKPGHYLWFIMIQSHYLNTHNDCGWELCIFPLVSVYGLEYHEFLRFLLALSCHLCPQFTGAADSRSSQLAM